jgi:hypothetical protein
MASYILSSDSNKAEILNTQFKSAYTHEDQRSLPDLGQNPTPLIIII